MVRVVCLQAILAVDTVYNTLLYAYLFFTFAVAGLKSFYILDVVAGVSSGDESSLYGRALEERRRAAADDGREEDDGHDGAPASGSRD